PYPEPPSPPRSDARRSWPWDSPSLSGLTLRQPPNRLMGGPMASSFTTGMAPNSRCKGRYADLARAAAPDSGDIALHERERHRVSPAARRGWGWQPHPDHSV